MKIIKKRCIYYTMQKNLTKQIIITAFLLIAVIALFQFTNLDILIQNFF